MTVAELMACLQLLPGDWPVAIGSAEDAHGLFTVDYRVEVRTGDGECLLRPSTAEQPILFSETWAAETDRS